MRKTGRSDTGFTRITIIGVGVIGGSLGLAIKKRYPDVAITGLDDPTVLRRALKRKAIDRAAANLGDAIPESDLVFIAAPVSEILNILPRVAKLCPARTLVTDVGSVKKSIVARARELFPNGNFIGGHPMAGVELSGIGAAHPLLFENAAYVLTPTVSNPARLVRAFAHFLKELGARVVVLDSVTHDEVVSAVSHLPQLTAVALTNVAGHNHGTSRNHLRLAAGGFRDLTRVASSRPDIWRDILTQNKNAIAKSLSLMIRELTAYRRLLSRRSPSGLVRKFRSARNIRNDIPKTMKGFLYQLAEVYVYVPDQPGKLAKLTAALTRARINVKDIELMKIREGRGGTFRLAFESRDVAGRASMILKRAGFEIGD